jgi:sterol desaturase/sphingolipid hydroxylase (fatty acid hydroxylase superfamily)
MTPADIRVSSDLPCLTPPSRAQLVVWAVVIACATALLCAVAVRLHVQLDLLQWWVPLAFLAGVALADLSSGLVHWAADTWGRGDLPVVGPRLLIPFRVHHLNPDDFLRRSFLDTNGDVAALALLPLIGLLWLPLDSGPAQVLAVVGLGFCALGSLTNQIHQWAHMVAPPRGVALLQGAGLLLSPRDHARHHGRPYDGDYCITTGWWNRPLEAIRFFRRLERAIAGLTGAVPRRDEHEMAAVGRVSSSDGHRHA